MAINKKRLERLERNQREKITRKRPDEQYDDVFPPEWSPKTGAQKGALESRADILLFGGAAGSLKTETMLVDAARESLNPYLRAIIFRSSLTQLTDIIDKTHRLYKPMGAHYEASSHTWRFPSGASVKFGYLGSDSDVFQYMGPGRVDILQ
jgi:hypothetical protein